MQALAREHDAGLDHFLVELAHGCQQFCARHDAGFAVLVGLHNHHESHRHAPFPIRWPVFSTIQTRLYRYDERDFAAPTCPTELFPQAIAGTQSLWRRPPTSETSQNT